MEPQPRPFEHEPAGDAYLQGRLAPPQFASLERALLADESARRHLLGLAAMEGFMPRALREVQGGAGADAGGRPRARRVRILALAAGAMVAMGLGLALVVRSLSPVLPPAPLPAGRLVDIRGVVDVLPPSGPEWKADSRRSAVGDGDRIRLDAHAEATFVHADGSRFRLYPGTLLRVAQSPAGPGLRVERGSLDAWVTPQTNGLRWKVWSGAMDAEVVGTEFRLLAWPQAAWLGVRQGKVVLTRTADGRRLGLARDQYAAVDGNWPFTPLNARVCPRWKALCRQATGSEYP